MKKRTYFMVIALGAALFFLNGCSPFTKVYSEEEPGVILSKYHTFNWLDNTTTKKGNNGPEWLTSSTQAKIRSAVEDKMGCYGYKICEEKPDLMLHYHVVIKNEVLYQQDWTCRGQGEGMYDRCNRVQPVQYSEGTFILDFIDTRNGNQIWRGAAVSVLNNMRPDEVDERIKGAVQAIFKKYPEQPIPRATP
jgi:hypothetical protein